MAKKKAATKLVASGRVCAFCGEKNCNCVKMMAGLKVLVGLAVLGYAAGYLTLNTAAWVVGVLALLSGLGLLMKG